MSEAVRRVEPGAAGATLGLVIAVALVVMLNVSQVALFLRLSKSALMRLTPKGGHYYLKYRELNGV